MRSENGVDLEPEGDAGQQGVHSVVDALLHGAIQADAGPVALPPQHRCNDELEAVRAQRLQLTAAQQLASLLRAAADCVLAGTCSQKRTALSRPFSTCDTCASLSEVWFRVIDRSITRVST